MGAVLKLRNHNKEEEDTAKAERILSQTLRSIKHPKLNNDVKEISKINKSTFRKAMRKFKSLNLDINDEDYDEQANKYVLKSMLNMLLELIPIQEENCRQFKNERAAYALNTYLNQARELIADIRAIQDFQTQANKIKDIFHQHILMIIQNLFDEAMKSRNMLNTNLKIENDIVKQEVVKSTMISFIQEHGNYIKEIEKSLKAQIDSFLVRNQTVKPSNNVRLARNAKG